MHQQNIIVTTLLIVFTTEISADCDRNTGPAGSPECVLLEPEYNKYQWATCLTNQYIQTYSKGKHICKDHYATYCYYQCMIEVHNDNGHGPVFDDCACGRDAPSHSVTSPISPISTPALPDWCYSPAGDNCNWYRECLEKRYPCEEEGNSYAIEFAEKFCNLYQEHYSKFSRIGQEWIDAVRKCLQVNLVPILRPFVHKTCQQIKEMAFESHSGCYLNPDDGKPSVCDIGIKNWWQVFWTVKSSAILAPSATFKQMLDVVKTCATNMLSNPSDNGMELMQLKVENKSVIGSDSVNKVAESIPKAMSYQLQWAQKGILYTSFPTTQLYRHNHRSETDGTVVSSFLVNVLLASSFEYNLNDNIRKTVNVSEAALDAAYAVQQGDIHFAMDEGLTFTHMSLCLNYNCSETSLQVNPAVTAAPNSTSRNKGLSKGALVIFVCAAVFGLARLSLN